MFTVFVKAFTTPDLRKKILFTLGMIIIFRFGAHVPIPGVSYPNVQTCIDAVEADNSKLLGLLNLFSGGALLQITIFALGILPYITASIIIQLLTAVIPRLEALKKEGQAGQAKTTQYTRYLTIGLALLQGAGLVTTARSGALFTGCPVAADIVPNKSVFTTAMMVLAITAGTACVMWIGELITDRGVGNGMSILVFISTAATLPGALWAIKQNGKIADGWVNFASVLAIGFVLVGLVVFVEQAQRRIPVQYTKRVIGRKSYSHSSTYIPLKVNQAGVIPVIFASSLLYIPALLAQFSSSDSGWKAWIESNFVTGSDPYYVITFFLLTVFFAFFYVSITFNPDEIAENMQKHGGFIPGYRAGKSTARYLGYVINRMTWPGALYLGIISLLPTVAFASYGGASQLSGISILIIVGVGLETVKQITSQLQQHDYSGFLR
ncbi:preprotein translocase subunit SecY [Streptomyces sp. NBC_00887]|uniref:preprotein translocase subunit SecY n=1 Tax=Streptomyces sp. NBC_00887 TaxID=2975859 RepID=UPI003864CAF6|nr:preprotein translocase subunit SecY [Streptomyces sp. NBC_00887]WSY36217.1 preprotein translocase subunit SecY [Streptomyces sp. NBC_00887]